MTNEMTNEMSEEIVKEIKRDVRGMLENEPPQEAGLWKRS
jgi:hypothetical protein